MITVNGKTLRNLEEQVEANRQDIQDFKDGNQTIAEFGITVVGILASENELPATGDNFGDAYLIGTETPYDMRVWTRNITEQKAMWVDLGAFPLQGPQGPKGDKGNSITSGNGEPTMAGQEGDMYINTATGYMYTYGATGWAQSFSLKGPKGEIGPQGKQGVQGERGYRGVQGERGPQGLKGDKGDYGPSFNIQGTLTSTANLPTPTKDMKDKGYAYIIPIDGVKHVYVISGEGSAMMWIDLGPSGIQGEKGDTGIGIDNLTDLDLTLGDTTVTYDTEEGISLTSTGRATYGNEQHDFTTDLQIPIKGTDGITIDKSADSETIEISGKNFIQMPDKTSLQRRIPYIVEGVRSVNYLYVDNAALAPNTIPVYRDPTAATAPYNNSCLYTGTPKSDYAAANKKYADDNFVAKTRNTTQLVSSLYVPVVQRNTADSTGASDVVYSKLATALSTVSGSVMLRDDKGCSLVECNGSDDKMVVNKKYVEDAIKAAGIGTYTFKTLFGNQNIVGEGNIDLYRHRVTITSTIDTTLKYSTEIISSQNFPIDSITDLKTYLGESFTQPIYGGYRSSSSDYAAGAYMTESYVYFFVPTYLSRESITNYTFSDTITTL